MAGASAYRMSAYPAYEPARHARPDVRVVPGTRTRTSNRPQTVSASAGLLVKLVVVMMIVAVAVGVACISLKSATSAVLADSSAIEASMSDMKSDSVTVEVQNSARASSGNIQAAAHKLGMGSPYEVGLITLDKDVVALDTSGALSLSGSIRNVAEAQG